MASQQPGGGVARVTWSKPFTEVEEAYVRERWGQLTAIEIAEKLGRSRRGVENLAKRLGLAAPRARVNAGVPQDSLPAVMRREERGREPEEPDKLEDLRWLRRQLRRQLADAGPQTAPKLAREYRETLDAIERAEVDDGDGGYDEGQEESQGVLAGIFSAILPSRAS